MSILPKPLRELESFLMTDGSGVIDLDRFLFTQGYHSFCSAHHDFSYDSIREDYCFTLYCWQDAERYYASINDSKVMYYQTFHTKMKYRRVRLAFWSREERDAQYQAAWAAIEEQEPPPPPAPCQYDVFYRARLGARRNITSHTHSIHSRLRIAPHWTILFYVNP